MLKWWWLGGLGKLVATQKQASPESRQASPDGLVCVLLHVAAVGAGRRGAQYGSVLRFVFVAELVVAKQTVKRRGGRCCELAGLARGKSKAG
jgi:hypothetical protein